MQLIINADDLGMSVEQNEQIELCINLGVVTSCTLMANGPEFEEGVRIAKKHQQISVGAHLNIIEFAPLTNREIFRKHGMLDENGWFIDGAAFVVVYDAELKQAIFEEWDAQITKIENAGIQPTHCDSHQHTHTIEALQDVLCSVLDKHKIYRVRRKVIPSIRLMLRERKQPATVHLDKSKSLKPKKRSILYRRFLLFSVKFNSWKWNRKMRKKYKITDAFYTFNNFFYNRDLIRLVGESTSVELMCHPGNTPFQKETENLMKNTSWKSDKYKIISYHQL